MCTAADSLRYHTTTLYEWRNKIEKVIFKRIVSSVCAAAMLAGTFAGVTKPASAAGATLGYWPEPLKFPTSTTMRTKPLQPYGSCFQIDELKNWSPDNDPDARYNLGAIPCGSAGWVPA